MVGVISYGKDGKMKLTDKQKAFCDYYIITLNASESARRAGYSPKTAECIGSENLQKPYLREYIDEQLKKKENERIAKADEVLMFLTSIMRGEITEQSPLVLGKTFKVLNKEPSVKDRLKASELLGKRYALFTEKHELSGNLGLSISVDYGEEIEEN